VPVFRPANVTPVRLAELAALIGASAPEAAGQTPVSGVTHASDQVRPGDLYAALPGARRHGAEFAAEAVAAGAVAVLSNVPVEVGVPVVLTDDPRAVLGTIADAVYGSPSARLTLIGITGTAGKTSTAYLIEAGLRAAGHVTGLIGTVETRLGDTVVDSVRTTPEATDLHALFAVALERGVSAMVMEVSSHALAMGRVGAVRFDVAGWTNFGADHLDFHASSDDYFAAKASFFDGRAGTEILNLDDKALDGLLKPATVTYSAQGTARATWFASDVREDGFGQLFLAHGPAGVVPAGVALPGQHNIANALLAIAALTATGVRPEVAAAGVAASPGVPGRLERVPSNGDIIGVVDYAHKTDAIVAALKALRELAASRGGRVICVLGAGGDRDKGKRPHMGAAAAEGADVLIVSDDNPRTEDPAAIREAVRQGAELAHGAQVLEVAGRREAIAEAVRLARSGDVVAVLGKGHERGQEINGELLAFDDRVELARALEGKA
jgi:UDP-N-acetylmuramoyl-L-alanyl-D-glutamate--2,6-diaminopimelate ligase